MAKTAMKIKQQRKAKFSTREYNPLQNLWSSTCILRENMEFAAICFRELAY